MFLWLVGGEELSWLAGWLDKGHARGSIVTSRPIDETTMAVSRKIDLLAESPACLVLICSGLLPIHGLYLLPLL